MNKRTGVGASNDKLNTNVYIGYKHQHSLRIESRGTVTHIAPPVLIQEIPSASHDGLGKCYDTVYS